MAKAKQYNDYPRVDRKKRLHKVVGIIIIPTEDSKKGFLKLH